MRLGLLLWLVLLLFTPDWLTAQIENRTRDSSYILLLEHRFSSGTPDTALITLKKKIVYRAQLIGPGAPVFQPVQRHPRNAFLAPISDSAGSEPRWFEVYAIQAGQYSISVKDIPASRATTLRLYEDVATTRQLTEKHDRSLAIGLLFGAGVHRRYRLDPGGGVYPRGGSDFEGCVLAQTSDHLATCIGASRQHFPAADFAAWWLFIEQHMGVLRHEWVRGHRTDLGAALRVGKAAYSGPRNTSPDLVAIGLYLTQHLAAEGRRLGFSLYASWEHSRLVGTEETEYLDTDRITIGVSWLP